MALELSIACGGRDLNRALLDGVVEPEGVLANTMAIFPSTRHRRFFRYRDFDVSEVSLATYLSAMSKPDEYPFTAIPVFPEKKFRHSFFYKRTDADIEEPADLAGKKVGISSWQTTANVWMRGIVQEHYGLDLEQVTWCRRKDDDIAMTVPDRYDVRRIPTEKGESVAERSNLVRALRNGDLDAAMDPSGTLFDAVVEDDDLAFMFADPLEEEREYFHQTSIHPPMHTVAIRDEVLEEHPWVAVNVYDAFCESRDICTGRNVTREKGSLTWAHLHKLDQERHLGPDTWAYGLNDRNRRSLEKFIEYAYDQGLVPRRYGPEELFVESTLGEIGN